MSRRTQALTYGKCTKATVYTNDCSTYDCNPRLPFARKLLDSLPRLQTGINLLVTKNSDSVCRRESHSLGTRPKKPVMIKMMTASQPPRDAAPPHLATIRALSSITPQQADIIAKAVQASGL